MAAFIEALIRSLCNAGNAPFVLKQLRRQLDQTALGNKKGGLMFLWIDLFAQESPKEEPL
jgi:hypothetical protein